MANFGQHMMPVQGQPFRFLDLDPQIKLMVYDELWRRSHPMIFRPISFRNQKLDGVLFQAEAEAWPVVGFPRWLLTNQEVLHSGLQQLWLRSTVTWFNSRGDYSYVSRKPCHLIDPYLPTKAQFDFEVVGRDFTGREDRFQMVPPTPTENQILSLLPRLNSNLRVLNLSMAYWFVDIDDSDDPRPWSFNFPRFASFVNGLALDEINVRLEILGDDVTEDSDYPEDAEDIKTAVENRVALLGARMLHGGGNIQPVFELQEIDSDMPHTAFVFQAKRVGLGNDWSPGWSLREQPYRWTVFSD